MPIVPHEITDEWADQTRTHWREVIAGGGDHLKILMDDETLFIGLNTGKAKDWNPDETLIKILVKRW